MVSCFKYFSGALSIFFIEFANGFEIAYVSAKPAPLEDIDLAQANFLFSLSLLGASHIAAGRTHVEKPRIVAAENRAPLSEANSKLRLNALFV